jgi:hypothetical protein
MVNELSFSHLFASSFFSFPLQKITTLGGLSVGSITEPSFYILQHSCDKLARIACSDQHHDASEVLSFILGLFLLFLWLWL